LKRITAFRVQPTRRSVDRILLPSTREATIRTRVSNGRMFRAVPSSNILARACQYLRGCPLTYIRSGYTLLRYGEG
jgi:hypothetical protein